MARISVELRRNKDYLVWIGMYLKQLFRIKRENPLLCRTAATGFNYFNYLLKAASLFPRYLYLEEEC